MQSFSLKQSMIKMKESLIQTKQQMKQQVSHAKQCIKLTQQEHKLRHKVNKIEAKLAKPGISELKRQSLEQKLLLNRQELMRIESIFQNTKDFDVALGNIQKQVDEIQIQSLSRLESKQIVHNYNRLDWLKNQVISILQETTDNSQVHFAQLINDRISILQDQYRPQMPKPEIQQVESIIQQQPIQQQPIQIQQPIQQSTVTTDSSQCQICMDKPKEFVAIPCGHFAYCVDCKEFTKKDNLCMICRTEIIQLLRIYQ